MISKLGSKPESKTLIATMVFRHLMDAWLDGARRFFVEGGTASSKTFSVMQFLKLVLGGSKEPLLATVTSESMPHLKRGAIRDFLTIMGDEIIASSWNRTDMIYTWANGSKLEFVSGDHSEKFTGARRNILFCNELNNIQRDVYREADLRTSRFTIGDWNPYSEFWFHDEKMGEQPENIFLNGLTYHDTPEIVSPAVIQVIESYKDKDPNYYRVHGLGLLGKLEGLVYPNFSQVDELPEGRYFYGLDYGFSSDPTTLVKNVIIGDKLYSQEMLYDASGLTNDMIAREMLLRGVKREPIYADPNEPKSMEELRKMGFNMQQAVMGKGSVAFGIQRVNQFYQHWTKDSLNGIKEQRNYRYIEDREHPGRFTEKTTHQWSHCFIAGTLIKTKRGDIPIEQVTPQDYVMTRQGWHKVKASGMTSPSEIVQEIIFSNGVSLVGTSAHLIWVKHKGYVPLHSCRYGDIIELCERQLSTRGKYIIGILTRPAGLTGYILGELGYGQIRKLTDTYIGRYGLITLGQFQRAIKCITKMATQIIIKLKTLTVFPEAGTALITQPLCLNGGENGLGIIFNNIDIERTLGTKQQKGKLYIQGLVRNRGKEESQLNGNVLIVSNYIYPERFQAQLSFVQTDAKHNIAGKLGETISQGFVHGAKRLSKLINTDQGKVAPVYALSVSEPHKERQAVYDLTIEEVPEFYANGILVHNCLDARRYAVASVKPGGRAVGYSPVVDYMKPRQETSILELLRRGNAGNL